MFGTLSLKLCLVQTSYDAPFYSLQISWFTFSHRRTTPINTFQFILILVGKLFSLLLLFIFVTFYIHESQLFQVNTSEMGDEKTGDDERKTSLYSSFSYYCDIYFEFTSDTRFISLHFTSAQLITTAPSSTTPPISISTSTSVFNVVRLAFATLSFPTAWSMSIEQYRIFKFININRYVQNGAEPRNSGGKCTYTHRNESTVFYILFVDCQNTPNFCV